MLLWAPGLAPPLVAPLEVAPGLVGVPVGAAVVHPAKVVEGEAAGGQDGFVAEVSGQANGGINGGGCGCGGRNWKKVFLTLVEWKDDQYRSVGITFPILEQLNQSVVNLSKMAPFLYYNSTYIEITEVISH